MTVDELKTKQKEAVLKPFWIYNQNDVRVLNN